MSLPRLAGAALLGALSLAPGVALAESQSSNSSSNCSNGRCTRVDSLLLQDDGGRVRGWRHAEHWREGHAPLPRYVWRAPRWPGDRFGRPRRDRDDDDD